jgi:hypothetical protein
MSRLKSSFVPGSAAESPGTIIIAVKNALVRDFMIFFSPKDGGVLIRPKAP